MGMKESSKKEMEKILRILTGKNRIDRRCPCLIFVTKTDTKKTTGMSDEDFAEIKSAIEIQVQDAFKWMISPEPKVLNLSISACYCEPMDAGAKDSILEGMDALLPILSAT